MKELKIYILGNEATVSVGGEEYHLTGVNYDSLSFGIIGFEAQLTVQYKSEEKSQSKEGVL